MTVSVLMSASLVMLATAGLCPADPTVELCDLTTTGNNTNATNQSGSGDESSGALRRAGAASGPIMAVALACGLGSKGGPSSQLLAPLVLSTLMVPGQAASAGGAESDRSLAATSGLHQTCSDMKSLYKSEACCGSPTKAVHVQAVPFPPKEGNKISGTNICSGKKPTAAAWANKDCMKNGVVNAVEQAGADVTRDFAGKLVTANLPAMKKYREMSPPLCPVNVHWHIGAEHRSAGEYDENGKSPKKAGSPATLSSGRRLNASERSLAGKERYGFACRHYDANNAIFTKAYDWKHCIGMHVGETYEVHWPHSALGACDTPHQYQSPFYDGVFCHYNPLALKPAGHKDLTPQDIAYHVGVQAQVFVIVNDESYYYPNLMKGMIVQDKFGSDLGIYTGSTTGTSRSNKVCSAFAPITWQVDRKCHLISASSFDKMCADMKQVNDDMATDLHAHGARELVIEKLSATNLANR